MNPINQTPYGKGDSTYQALGGFDGITQLVDNFYRVMESDEAFQHISDMHTEADDIKREKLVYFLCGWTGGAENYAQRFARNISMPGAHAHLDIGEAERDQWLTCMGKALAQQGYPEDLQRYLLTALAQPAEVIRRICEQRQQRAHDK